MKKIFIAIMVVGLLGITSCNSNTASSLLGGTWTFKGLSYNAVTAIGSTTAKTLTATTANTSEVDDLVFHFSSFPPAAGTYTVTNVPVTSASQVYVIMNIGTKVYTIDNSASANATVIVSGSKVSVSVPSVTFSNTVLQAADQGSFTASISENL